MFRVNQTEWINPRLIGVEYVRIIPCQDQKEKDCLRRHHNQRRRYFQFGVL